MILQSNSVATNRRRLASDARLSARHAALIRESWWLLVVAAVGVLALVLVTYHKTDAGWSFSGAGMPIQNKGGVVGAWIADVLLYLFGVSAWWWVFAGIVLVVAGHPRIGPPGHTSPGRPPPPPSAPR